MTTGVLMKVTRSAISVFAIPNTLYCEIIGKIKATYNWYHTICPGCKNKMLLFLLHSERPEKNKKGGKKKKDRISVLDILTPKKLSIKTWRMT